MTPNLDELEALASAMVPLMPLELSKQWENEIYECPACGGTGEVDGETWETQKAATIQAYGIGVSLDTATKYLAAMNPETTLALIARIRELEQEKSK